MSIDAAISGISDSQACDEAVRRRTSLVAGAFFLNMVLQAVGYLVLGTAQSGMSVSQLLMLGQYTLAMYCAWGALRRTRGTARLFWLLFLATDFVLMIPSAIQLLEAFSGHSIVSDATWRAIYLLYGAPVFMMLVLPDASDQRRIRPEVLLDLFQVTLVVGLSFSILFYVPLQQMLPADALEHNLTVSNLVSILLLLAILLRLRFAGIAAARDRLLRLGVFLFTCAVVTFIGNWIDQHHYTVASAWWDLGWDLPIIAASMVAATGQDSSEMHTMPNHPGLLTLVGKNLGLVVALFGVALIVGRWSPPRYSVITNAAIAASLVAFTLRLALTQHRQQQEITQRMAAQTQLTEANNRIGVLLEEARRQAAEITKVNELVSLLQACSSATEAYKLVSECLQGLFPQCSGCVTQVNPGAERVDPVIEWGPNPPAGKAYSPSECWALRRGATHILSGSESALRCHHLSGNGPSVCIPLIANGAAIGTLAMQEQEPWRASAGTQTPAKSESFTRRCDLIVAVSRHLTLTMSNLGMREALRLQAVRDPLTGLYNRRYMQEFLDRETVRACRNKRPVSVLALDLDNFKSFNDNFGHATGDLALKLAGEFLLRSVRSDDVACRYGGEEFTIILPECSLQQALRRAEQIRAGLEKRSFEHQGIALKVTVSIGVAAFDETTDRVDRLLACADEALYEAKRAGRNRVVAARPVPSAGKRETEAAASGSF
jgi:diguanylate cyclase (GGDEF)-like protein